MDGMVLTRGNDWKNLDNERIEVVNAELRGV